MDSISEKAEKRQLLHTWFFPVVFVLMLWIIKSAEIVFHFPLYPFGVYPRAWQGLSGILFAPLIHADYGHLFSNTIPLLVLGMGLFHFYRGLSYRIFFIIYLVSGMWVWVSARPSFHIGASGLVYGLAAYLLTSGVIKKNIHLSSFSLVVVFLYGNLIWGVLPIMPRISWESHLLGALAGVVLAIYYRSKGPQRTSYTWESEETNEQDGVAEIAEDTPEGPVSFTQGKSDPISYFSDDESRNSHTA